MKSSTLCFFALPLIFLGCSKMDSSSDTSSNVTIVINSPEGKTVMTVDENSRNMTRAIFTDAETQAVTSKKYEYDSSNNLRSVSVTDTREGIYTINYEGIKDNTERSVIDEQTDIPKQVQKISKTYASGERSSLANKEADTVEYYYDENGKLGGIFRIDDKNNIIYKEGSK